MSARASFPHRASYQLADGPSSATFFATRGGLTGPAPALATSSASQPPLPRDKPRLIYVGPANPGACSWTSSTMGPSLSLLCPAV